MASQGTAVVDTIEDYSKMKVVELKKLLKDRGLPVTGAKDELIERLKQANEAAEKKLLEETMEEAGESGAAAASIDEELENEIMNDENKVTSTSVVKPGDKRKLPAQNGATGNPAQPPTKKLEVEENKENSGTGDATGDKSKMNSDGGADDKKIIRLSAITPEEKKALRAKKFGLTEEEKKEARAKRFGITAETKANITKLVKGPGGVTKVNKSTELLKKRAERFGLTGATKLTPEEEEKRKKRAERFGTATPDKTATPEKTAIAAADKK